MEDESLNVKVRITESDFEKTYKNIKDAEKEGFILVPNACSYLGGKKDDVINQPVEGLLYDLGLDEAVLATLYKENPDEFMRQMAVANVIKHLHKKYKENENTLHLTPTEEFEKLDKQIKRDLSYLQMAFIWAKNSHAIRRKVGCVIVKDNMIISDGFNGTPAGFPNACEYAVGPDDGTSDYTGDDIDELKRLEKQGWRLITYPCVLHAETNALSKLVKYGGGITAGATVYITDEPCVNCSKLIIQSGATRVVYARDYSSHEGIELLKKAGITVDHYHDINI